MEFDLEDALLAANLTTNKLKFQGLSDTTELRDTVNEFFEGSQAVVNINNIQGKPEQFLAISKMA